MAKAEIEPRWLVSLMCQWARRQIPGYVQGFPKKVAFLLIHSSTPARTDPTGESAEDFSDLDIALEDCRENRLEQWAALMMHYKPWSICGLQAEGFPFAPNKVYFDNLHKAHSCLETKMNSLKNARTSSLSP